MASFDLPLILAVLSAVASTVKLACYYQDIQGVETYKCSDNNYSDVYVTLSAGAIVGAVIGSLVGLAIVIAIIVVICRVCCGASRPSQPGTVMLCSPTGSGVDVIQTTTQQTGVSYPPPQGGNINYGYDQSVAPPASAYLAPAPTPVGQMAPPLYPSK